MLWLLWLAGCVLCATLGKARGRDPVMCFGAGLFLGPLALVWIAITDARPQCTACRERIDREATICPKCRTARAAS